MSEHQAVNLWLRGSITEAELNVFLWKLGYQDENLPAVKELAFVLPPVQDLITMAVREVFTPEIAQRFGQFEDFPEAFVLQAAKVGLSREHALNYWAAHWALPSLTMGFEMLHRGAIEDDDIDLLMRAHDMMPFWRDKIKAISYRPYTRVDVRRMHKIGKIGPEKVEELYRHRGFSPDDARLMTEWTIEYNGGDDRELTKSDILKGYEDGDLTQQDAFDMLTSLGYDDNMAGYYVFRVDQEKDRSLRMDYLEDIKFRYINNVISRADAEREILRIGFDLSRVNALMSKYDNLRKENDKLPSKTDLDKQLRHKIISEADYRLEMSHLGYKDLYISRYVEMIGKVE